MLILFRQSPSLYTTSIIKYNNGCQSFCLGLILLLPNTEAHCELNLCDVLNAFVE